MKINLPDGTKRTIGAVISIVNTYLTNTGIYGVDESNMITALAAVIFAVGMVHSRQKNKKQK